MKKMITYKELQKFDTAATNYLILNGYFTTAQKNELGHIIKPGFFTDKAATKLVLNIKNVIKQCNKHIEAYQEEVADIYNKLCLEDPKTKALLYNDNGTHKLDREGTQKAKDQIKALSEKEVEIHARITEGELSLTEEEKEAFNGIVIPQFKPEETEQ